MSYGIGKKDEWFTPKKYFDALGDIFDLDPCHPSFETFSSAKTKFTKIDNGLEKKWFGNVWMNPPFGGKNGYFPWVDKFINHGSGIGLFTSLTSSQGFQKYIPQMDAILFPSEKTKFFETEKLIERKQPFNGIVMFALGDKNVIALQESGLGLFIDLRNSITKTINKNEG